MHPIIRPLSQEFLYASPEALDRASYRALAPTAGQRPASRCEHRTDRRRHAPRPTR